METTYESYNKGQVTIPQKIREKLNITPAVEIDFVEEKDRIYLVSCSVLRIIQGVNTK
ncbi:MAG: AbrB/MazE/SpoVT family DNA-binding domain-containing protein [Desulfatiglans sp.]|nr:AbrB/MazE/SpoVT family DNA-binding domain-containing protein [Desulfatiglans sp.]